MQSPDESVRDDTDANGLFFLFLFLSHRFGKKSHESLLQTLAAFRQLAKSSCGDYRDGAAFHMLEYLGK